MKKCVINYIEQNSLKTPCYLYDMDLLDNTLEVVSSIALKNDFHIHYAMKANVNPSVLQTISKKGLGADCVSGNEILSALKNGFPSDKIVFAGVGKADWEINLALDHDIFAFNCESIQEIEVINGLAEKKNKIASIALRLNPDVKANTHEYISTGLKDNKFGISMNDLDTVINLVEQSDYICLNGLHFHIGSQIVEMDNFKNLCTRVNDLQEWFGNRNVFFDYINVGGGLGINYHEPDVDAIPDFESYFQVFNKFLKLKSGQSLHFELGRSIVGQCGSLISKVLYIKEGFKTSFCILDAGMTELIRPALYQAYHKIENLSSNRSETKIYDVVGPICESSDCFGRGLLLNETLRGDYIAIRSSGAYGEVMTSRYNLKDAPSVCLFRD